MGDMRDPDQMRAAAATYLQIKEWIKLEEDIRDLQRQLETATADVAKAEIAAAAAGARAEKAEADLRTAQSTGSRQAEEAERAMRTMTAAADTATRAQAAAELALAAARAIPPTPKPGKKGANLATDNTPVPPVAQRAPLEIVYTPQYDAAGKLSRIIAREKT